MKTDGTATTIASEEPTAHAHAREQAHLASPDVFERVERKYVLTREQYETLMRAIAPHVEDDAFPHSKISSLYYDTPNFDMISRSLEKPLYKEKLRLRAYNEPALDDAVYLELKKKFKGVVYKRRVRMSLAAARAYMGGMSFSQAIERYPLKDEAAQQACKAQKSMQILHEIEACRDRWQNPGPAMMIVVKRDALRSRDGDGVRLTFDHNPCWREDHLTFGDDDSNVKILDDDKVLMEVKCLGAYPFWLIDALDEIKAYPTSFSKYGRGYQALRHPQAPHVSHATLPAKHAAQNGTEARSRPKRGRLLHASAHRQP